MASSSTETNITPTEPPPKKQKCLGFEGIENVQRILECPVCYNTPGHPDQVHFCSNGHLLCDGCYKKILDKKCPTCRSEDWNGQNPLMPLMKQILAALPKVCPFPECETQFKNEDRDNHLKNCQYRLVDCSDCNLKLPFNTFLKHLKEDHGALTKQNNEGKFNNFLLLKENDNRRSISWIRNISEFDNQTFIAASFREDDHIFIQIFLHGNITDAEKYLCKIEVANLDDPKYKIIFFGDIISIDVPTADLGRRNHSGSFSFARSMAQKFLCKLSNGQGLASTVTISKKE